MCVCHECTCECMLTNLCVYLCVSMQNLVNVCVCVCPFVCLSDRARGVLHAHTHSS